MTRRRHQPEPTTDGTDRECFTYCERFYDFEQCKTVCLSLSPQNKSLFRRALLWAEAEGLPDEAAHTFAAGAVWAWAELRKKVLLT